MNDPTRIEGLLSGNRKEIWFLSGLAALLMTGLSLLGLLRPDQLYPTPGMKTAFLTNDLVNLGLGLPLFIGALSLMGRGKPLGALLLPGALLYLVYNYLAYGLGRPFSWVSLIYFSLVLLSLFALGFWIHSIDSQAVSQHLAGQLPGRLTGGILVFFGAAFIGLAGSQILGGIRSGTIPPLGEDAVAVADIILSIGWMWGGVSLLRRRPLGFASGLALLTAASSLFLGLLFFFFLAPGLTGRLFDWGEVVTVAGMGLIAFIPTGLYLRGILRADFEEDH